MSGGRTPLAPVPMDDAGSYQWQVAASRYGRELVGNVAHISGYRGRVLVTQAFTPSNGAIILNETEQTVGDWLLTRSNDERDVTIIATLRLTTPTRVGGTAVFAEYDGTGTDSHTLTTTSVDGTDILGIDNPNLYSRRGGRYARVQWRLDADKNISLATRLTLSLNSEPGVARLEGIVVRESVHTGAAG